MNGSANVSGSSSDGWPCPDEYAFIDFASTIHAYTLFRMKDTDPGCSCFAVRRLARRISRFYDRRLAPEGLRTTQYSLLAHLRAPDGMSMRDLASRLDMDRSTLNRNVRPLLEAGWVASRPGKDPRSLVLSLTAEGRAKHAAARHRWARVQTEFGNAMGKEALERLHADIAAALRALPEEANPKNPE